MIDELQDRKGTGYVKPEMFKDLVDEDCTFFELQHSQNMRRML